MDLDALFDRLSRHPRFPTAVFGGGANIAAGARGLAQSLPSRGSGNDSRAGKGF